MQVRVRAMMLGLTAAAIMAGGCGGQMGALMYHSGMFDQTVPAEYQLPPGSKLILVDDDSDQLPSQHVQEALVDTLAQELKNAGLAQQVTTNDEISQIRQATPNFDKTAADAVGRKANADVVIWIKVVRFTLEDDLDMVIAPAHFTVMLKVLNSRATDRKDVRLWPTDPDGRLVEAEVDPHTIRRCKDAKQAQTKMAEELTVEIMKLFVEQKVQR